jgi:GTPase SAR1 family protein
MKNKPEITNLEKTLEILEVLNGYIDDNNEIKPELFMNAQGVFKIISIFSDVSIDEIKKENALDVFTSFNYYLQINEILEANTITKRFKLR